MSNNMYVVDPGAFEITWFTTEDPGYVWCGDQCFTYIPHDGLFLGGDINGEFLDRVRITNAVPKNAIPWMFTATTSLIYLGLINLDTGSTELWTITPGGSATRDLTLPEDYDTLTWGGLESVIDNNAVASPSPHWRYQVDPFSAPLDQVADVVSHGELVIAAGGDDFTKDYTSVWHGVIESDEHEIVPEQPEPITPPIEDRTIDARPSTTSPGKAMVFWYDNDSEDPAQGISQTEWATATFYASNAGVTVAFWWYDAFYGPFPNSIVKGNPIPNDGVLFDEGGGITQPLIACYFHVFNHGIDGFDHLYVNIIDPDNNDTLQLIYGGSADLPENFIATISYKHQPDDIQPPFLAPMSEYVFYGSGHSERSNFHLSKHVDLGALQRFPAWIATPGGRTTAIPGIRQFGGDAGDPAKGTVAIHVEKWEINPGPIETRTRFTGT